MQSREAARAGVALVAISAWLGACGSGPTGGRPPNIVVILADDVGVMDVGAYAARTHGVERSATFYETPHIDQLADRGVAFAQSYSSFLCSPSRAALLTGVHPARLGVTTAWFDDDPHAYGQGVAPRAGHNALDATHEDDVDFEMAWRGAPVLMALPSGSPIEGGLDDQLLPELLPDYDSAFIGKWHVGGAGVPEAQPDRQGFDRVLAHLDGGGVDYFRWPFVFTPGNWTNIASNPALHAKARLRGSWEGRPEPGYLTEVLTDRAVSYLRERAETPDAPFLLFVSHFAVHAPLQAPPDIVRRFAAKPTRGWNGHVKPVQAAMLEVLDESVGRIVNTLALTGQLENTVVVFTADNGGVSHATPYRGGKGFINEGGIRVPLIVAAPGGATGWSEALVDATDIVPTLLELAEAEVPGHLDGLSFAAQLRRPDLSGEERALVWHFPTNLGARVPERELLPVPPQSALRRGDYKLIWDWHGRLELYDIARDPGEHRNLADEQPERALAMFDELERWLDGNVERRYFPRLDPTYDAAADTRSYPLRDLRAELLGRTDPIGLPDAAGRNARAARAGG